MQLHVDFDSLRLLNGDFLPDHGRKPLFEGVTSQVAGVDPIVLTNDAVVRMNQNQMFVPAAGTFQLAFNSNAVEILSTVSLETMDVHVSLADGHLRRVIFKQHSVIFNQHNSGCTIHFEIIALVLDSPREGHLVQVIQTLLATGVFDAANGFDDGGKVLKLLGEHGIISMDFVETDEVPLSTLFKE